MLVPVLALAISASAAAQEKVPAAFRGLRPDQMVEAVAAERHTLGFTPEQARRLDSLRLAIRTESHRYAPAPVPGKAHENRRMRPMISGQRAYADALAILTADQRARATTRFEAADYRLPAGLQPRLGQPAATEPLRHHAADTAQLPPSTKTGDAAEDPLQHHLGETPTAEDTGATTANPMTHHQ